VVCDAGSDRVAAIDRATSQQTSLVTDLAAPFDVAVVEDGMIVAEAGRHRLWRLTADSRRVLVEEDTPGQPSGVAAAADGTVVWVDADTSSLRRRSPNGETTTLVGQGLWDWGASDGGPDTAALQSPGGVALGPDGTVYVADTLNDMIRAWDGQELRTLPVAGLSTPGDVAVLPDGRLVIADTGNHRVVVVAPDAADPQPIEIDESWLGTVAGPAFGLRVDEEVALPFAVDLGAFAVDRSSGPPVRVEVTADPATLLAPGARSWALAETTGDVRVRAGAPGDGVLVLTVEAHVADDERATVLRTRTRHDVTITPAANEGP
jgi:DNA-binding beta-propeller fold protein YncE